MEFEQLLAQFDYAFPPELIAKEPAHPRDSARLLVYDRTKKSTSFDVFSNLTNHLPKNALVVMNRTKVIPAKMSLKKKTGGAVSALWLETKSDSIRVLASGSFKAGDTLMWEDDHSFTVQERNEQEALLKPEFEIKKFDQILEAYGSTPLPPYMKDSPLKESQRRDEYQTVFAKEKGSVAAPTAGLHFTEELIKKVVQHGGGVAYVTLHVGLGTFAPLTEKHIATQTLHTERYEIDAATVKTLNKAKAAGRPIVAVGTTTVRTLESASDDSIIVRPRGDTNIFITESTPIHFTNHLITNFHVPRSSLLMLVSAFTGREKLLDIYRQAIAEKMRLFSFGDAMLII